MQIAVNRFRESHQYYDTRFNEQYALCKEQLRL